MHYFYGNQQTGFWWAMIGQTGHCFNPKEIVDDPSIVWIRTHDSGDFYWPHLTGPNGPIPLNYEDDVDSLDDQKARLGITLRT